MEMERYHMQLFHYVENLHIYEYSAGRILYLCHRQTECRHGAKRMG